MAARYKRILFSLLILIAPLFYMAIGTPIAPLEKDASNYDTFATHMLEGKGYTFDGTHFSNLREPGYPTLVALVYSIFGLHDVVAVAWVQSLMLGFLGVLVWWIFIKLRAEYLGLIPAFATALLPSYGLYTHIEGTEILFTCLLGLLFYACFVAVQARGDVSPRIYAYIGLLCGLGTLTRAQLLFFCPFLILWLLLWLRREYSRELLYKLATGFATFLVVIGAWSLYVHAHMGTYSLTTGRAEAVIYTRAVRAQLSYGQLTQYAYDWIHRSISGGVGTPLLTDNEYQKTQVYFGQVATTTALVAAYNKQDIDIIRHNFGHYLYGNLIEVVKLGWIEHDFGDYLNRYVRAGMYALIYSLFVFGLWTLWRQGVANVYDRVSVLALVFIAYNYLVITPFDAIPRYNTPYLWLYVVVGMSGIALWRRTPSVQE